MRQDIKDDTDKARHKRKDNAKEVTNTEEATLRMQCLHDNTVKAMLSRLGTQGNGNKVTPYRQGQQGKVGKAVLGRQGQ